MKPSESKNEDLKETVIRETISENEKKYRILFDSMLLGVFYQGTDGRITDVNPAALKIVRIY